MDNDNGQRNIGTGIGADKKKKIKESDFIKLISYPLCHMESFMPVKQPERLIGAQDQKNEASTGSHPWYPSFLSDIIGEHYPPTPYRLRKGYPHSFTGSLLWSSAKADKRM